MSSRTEKSPRSSISPKRGAIVSNLKASSNESRSRPANISCNKIPLLEHAIYCGAGIQTKHQRPFRRPEKGSHPVETSCHSATQWHRGGSLEGFQRLASSVPTPFCLTLFCAFWFSTSLVLVNFMPPHCCLVPFQEAHWMATGCN